MRSYTRFAIVSLIFLVSGCSVAQPATDTSASRESGTPTAAADHAGHETMEMQTAATDTVAPFDATFIDGMIEHHQGAIDMAEMALEEAEHEEIRTLSEGIIAAQNAEIGQMQSWRSAWYPDLAPTEGMQMDMGDMMIRDDASAPFDQRFLEAMISHHQGAIDMAKIALEEAEHAEIRTLAEAIITAQKAEIEQMRGWLTEWYGIRQ